MAYGQNAPSCDPLNCSKDAAGRTYAGSAFHSFGAADENARLPYVLVWTAYMYNVHIEAGSWMMI